jgi:hypothetical protein
VLLQKRCKRAAQPLFCWQALAFCYNNGSVCQRGSRYAKQVAAMRVLRKSGM